MNEIRNRLTQFKTPKPNIGYYGLKVSIKSLLQ